MAVQHLDSALVLQDTAYSGVLTNISYKPLASIFSVKVYPKSLWPHPR
jgi:hypothetical protein